MKQHEVKMGATYLTKVGETLVRVVVVRTYSFATRRGTGFVCKREDNGNVLPKARRAAALREVT